MFFWAFEPKGSRCENEQRPCASFSLQNTSFLSSDTPFLMSEVPLYPCACLIILFCERKVCITRAKIFAHSTSMQTVHLTGTQIPIQNGQHFAKLTACEWELTLSQFPHTRRQIHGLGQRGVREKFGAGSAVSPMCTLLGTRRFLACIRLTSLRMGNGPKTHNLRVWLPIFSTDAPIYKEAQ